MKTMIYPLSLGLVMLFLTSYPAGAQDVLLLNEQCGGSTAYFPAALTNLGYDFVETNDAWTFYDQLTDGTLWDLLIIDEYLSRLDPLITAEIQAYVAGGGRVYMSYWAWDGSLALSFEAELIDHTYHPLEVYRWQPGHPLFDGINAVPDLVPSRDTCRADGARFEPIGSAVAGYSAAPSPGQAGLIVGNEGRTVLFGGIPGLFDGNVDGDLMPDMLELAENVILFLLPGDCIPDATTLCIDDRPGDRRFKVSLHYASALGEGVDGDAAAVRLSRLGIPRGGLFCFRDPANPEVLVKVLNGCHVNGHIWVFYAAATTLGFELTVEDTSEGIVKTYVNADLVPAPTVADTAAFNTCADPVSRAPEISWRPSPRDEDLIRALRDAPAPSNPLEPAS